MRVGVGGVKAVSDGNTARAGMPSETTAIAESLQSLALVGASSIEDIVAILQHRSASDESDCWTGVPVPTVLPPSCVRTVHALPHSRDCHQLKQALTLILHHFLSFFKIQYRSSSCAQRICTFLCEGAKESVGENRKLLGVCVSVSSAVKCVWNTMSIQPHRSLRWECCNSSSTRSFRWERRAHSDRQYARAYT